MARGMGTKHAGHPSGSIQRSCTMAHTSFKSRLLGILLTINVGVLVLGGAAFYFLTGLGDHLHHVSTGVLHRLEVVAALQDAADRRAIAVRNLALLTQPAFAEIPDDVSRSQRFAITRLRRRTVGVSCSAKCRRAKSARRVSLERYVAVPVAPPVQDRTSGDRS